MINGLIPKVLIAAPTSDRHEHLLDEWISSLDSLTYKYIDILLVDTSKESDKYFKKLKTKLVHKKNIQVLRMEWDPEEIHILRHLANVRNKIREEFLKSEHTHLFFLDSDIFLPKNSIQSLLSHNKDNVGFCVPIYEKVNEKPCILKSGDISFAKGLDLFSFDEINEYNAFSKKFKEGKLTESENNLVPFIIKDLSKPNLFKPYAVNIGCLMIKRKVLEEVPFRTHPTFLMGEDLWFFNECNEKHFEFWCDVSIDPIHKNMNWSKVDFNRRGSTQFFIAQGPAEADNVEFVEEFEEQDTETKVFVIDE